MDDTPRGPDIRELGTSVLRTIVRAKHFWDSMLWGHFLEQQDDFGGFALARWKMLDEDYL